MNDVNDERLEDQLNIESLCSLWAFWVPVHYLQNNCHILPRVNCTGIEIRRGTAIFERGAWLTDVINLGAWAGLRRWKRPHIWLFLGAFHFINMSDVLKFPWEGKGQAWKSWVILSLCRIYFLIFPPIQWGLCWLIYCITCQLVVVRSGLSRQTDAFHEELTIALKDVGKRA